VEVKEPDERLKSLANFYDKYTKENIDKLKPLFEAFCKNVDFNSLMNFDLQYEDVKRSMAVRDTLTVHTKPLKLKDLT
jgi:hypothetical protein